MAKKVGLKNVRKGLLMFLDGLPIGRRKRAIQSLLQLLNFQLRWWSLSNKERERLERRQPLSPQEKAALELEQTKEGREERINMYARARHSSELAWVAYLSGETDVKPPLPVN